MRPVLNYGEGQMSSLQRQFHLAMIPGNTSQGGGLSLTAGGGYRKVRRSNKKVETGNSGLWGFLAVSAEVRGLCRMNTLWSGVSCRNGVGFEVSDLQELEMSFGRNFSLTVRVSLHMTSRTA
jgi:hypothetical protein